METTPTHGTSRGEAAQLVLLIVNAAWTTWCLGGYRPATMLVTSVLLAASLTLHFLTRTFSRAPFSWYPAGGLVVPFLGYAAINVAVISPVHWLGWRDWCEWCVLLGTFWIVVNDVRSTAGRRVLFCAWVAIASTSIVAACYQRFVDPRWLMLGRHQAEQFIGRSSGTFGIPNSLGALLILFIPALLVISLTKFATFRWRMVSAGVAAFFIFGLILTISRGAWLGLAGALLCTPLVFRRWTPRRRWGALAVIALALAVVLGAAAASSPRVRQRWTEFRANAGEQSRPILWHAAVKIWSEHPWFGSGGGSFNTEFEAFRPEGFRDNPEWAHSDYLNTASDYGAVGFILLFGSIATGMIVARRRSQMLSRASGNEGLSDAFAFGLSIGLLAFALHLAVDFHWKIPALALASGTCAALAVGEVWPARPVFPLKVSRFPGAPPVCALAAICLGFWWWHIYRAEALRYRAHESLDRLANDQPFDFAAREALERQLRRAVEIDPQNANAWSDLSGAQTLAAFGPKPDFENIGIVAAGSARHAIELSPVVAEFWWRLGVAQDLRGSWSEAGASFVRALNLSPNSTRVWYYYAYHQSLNPVGRDLAASALETCLRLDPENEAALALRQRLALTPNRPIRENP